MKNYFVGLANPARPRSQRQRQLRLAMLAPAALLSSGWALAVTPGVSAWDLTQVVNPFSSQATDAWKLVGTGQCASAFQISREWVISSQHCPIDVSPVGEPAKVFNNALSGSLSSTLTDCARASGYVWATRTNDIVLCRLVHPDRFAAPSAYPPLAIAPARQAKDATKWGELLIFGWGDAGALVNFTQFNGAPYGFDPAVDGNDKLPVAVNNDSGGAAFWFSPTSHLPAAVGVLSNGTFTPASPWYFTQDNLDFIHDHIAAHGGDQPPVVTTAAHYGGPAGDPAPDLPAPPTAKAVGTNLTVAWTTPALAPGVSISGYDVRVGSGGVLHRSATVASGVGNTASWTGVPTSKTTRVCVIANNAIGKANSTYLGAYPNCATLDTRVPSAVPSVSLAATTVSAAVRRVTSTWTAPTTPSDLASVSYYIVQTRQLGSTVKSATHEQASQSLAVTVAPGTTVCTSVSAVGPVARGSATTQCLTAN